MKTNKNFLLTIIALFLILHVYAQNSGKQITLEDIYKKNLFTIKSISEVASMNDGLYYTILEDDYSKIVKYNYQTGEKVKTLLDINSLKIKGVAEIYDYEFNSDESKILFSTNYKRIYRYSFEAYYYVFDIKTASVTPLSENGKQRLASFSPDGKNIAFVRGNNIFIKNLKNNKEQQITSDGKYNEIINGATDWVYEEEFAFSKAYAWSGDGQKIAFFRFDESRVKQFNMTKFNDLYPENYTFKYPKAGEENSIVSIHVYNVSDGKTRSMDIGEETDQYISRIKWTKDPDVLAIIRQNRLQNNVEILLANASSGKSKVIYKDINKYYISEVSDNYVTFLDDKKHFIVPSERGGFEHFYLYNLDGKLINQITKGKWDIYNFIGVNNTSKRLFYTSYEESSLQRHVYSIKLDGSDKIRLSKKPGWNAAEFSKGFKYYINYHSDANTPYYITLHNVKGDLIRVLENNKVLKNRINEYTFSTKEFMVIKTSEGIELNAYMIKPVDFDPKKEYPLFMYVYGGPGSQNVREQWSRYNPWFNLLAQNGYIVAAVDNRGTSGKGEEFKKCVYMQLGNLETIDQTEAAKYLGSLPYIDESRIGIFGWSYGGYMSALCMTKGADVFKMGIAVAPVSSWRYYDTVYTERFMRTPQENADGYDDNSPINFADKLKGAFLLVHGTADDNVHAQNAFELAEALVKANKQFDMQIYKDRNHYIRGGNTSLHLFTRMTNFILDNL